MKSKCFIYLEITDSILNTFISNVFKIINKDEMDGAVHITIQGPHYWPLENDVLNKIREKMKGDILQISGIGSFSNKSEEVVYLKINSENLRKVWHKPDYPIEKFGFNPHISLYRGSDKKFAALIKNYLENENIKLLTEKFEIVSHVTRQEDWIGREQPRELQCVDYFTTGKIRLNFFNDLIRMIRNYQSNKATDALKLNDSNNKSDSKENEKNLRVAL